MQVVILSDSNLQEELLAQVPDGTAGFVWVTDPEHLLNYPEADAYIDLLFQPEKRRLELLAGLPGVPVFINDVVGSQVKNSPNIIRINGWRTFLRRPVTEACCDDKKIQETASLIFSQFGKKIEWLPDIPGFVTARVVSLLVNEAYFTLQEGVSTASEIDTAMKLGTNYPFGPFEWSRLIGINNIFGLLQSLSQLQKRYTPAALLEKEAQG